jgi:hypothetical protein
MTTKIFCGKCKYRTLLDHDRNLYCKHPKNVLTQTSAIRQTKQLQHCDFLNRSNDCSYFTPKWLFIRKLLGFDKPTIREPEVFQGK